MEEIVKKMWFVLRESFNETCGFKRASAYDRDRAAIRLNLKIGSVFTISWTLLTTRLLSPA